jgi:hypothetical protein
MAEGSTRHQPPPDGYSTWQEYWTAKGMPWRIEPEIDEDRQATLRERLARKSDVDLGMYPFKDYPLIAPMLSGCWPVLEWHPS